MKSLLKSPFGIAIAVFIFLLIVFFVFSIPTYDALLVFEKGLVRFELNQKVSLLNLLNMKLDDLIVNGILPKVSLNGKGIMLLIIIHIGLPFLIYIRFKAANDRKKLDE